MTRTPRLARWSAAALAAAALAATSCGKFVREEKLPETGATLEGTVKYGNDQLQFAMIQVLSPSGSTTGMIGEDGRYRIENVPIGDVKIGVNTSAATGEYQSKMMAAGVYKGPEAHGKGKVQGPRFIAVPEKYFNPETSGISTTVKKGTNTFDIVIPK